MRALVVHTGGIGDFLLTLPALTRLAETHQLILAGSVDRLHLAVAAGIAQEAVSLDSIQFDSLFSEPAPELRELVDTMDRIVVWMRDHDGALRTLLESITTAHIDIHPGLPPENWTRHASEYYSEMLGYESTKPIRLSISPPPEQHDIVIHPGSGGRKKNWPLDHYLALAEQLRHANRHVVWSLGPAETEQEAFGKLIPILPCASLSELASHLTATRLYIGNDSGITHVAAAVGTLTVAIFGVTNPIVWAPRGDHVTVIDDGFRNPEAAMRQIHELVTRHRG